MSRRHAASWAGWVVGAMIAGCGSDSTQVAAPVDAFSSKACVSDMQEIGPEGGVLSAGPYLLTVPAGALLSSRTLTLEQESCGQWPLRLGPEGTQFMLPATLEFARPQPNPASGPVTLSFALPRAAEVDVDVLDLQGRVVRSLLHGARSAGRHSLTWDGADDQGRESAPGVYFARVKAGVEASTQRIVRVR